MGQQRSVHWAGWPGRMTGLRDGDRVADGDGPIGWPGGACRVYKTGGSLDVSLTSSSRAVTSPC